MQVISGKFLGDFQRHYDEKGYTIFDSVFETLITCGFLTAKVGAHATTNVYIAPCSTKKPEESNIVGAR